MVSTLGYRDPQLVHMCLARLVTLVDQVEPQHVANALQCMVSQGHAPPEVARVLAVRFGKMLMSARGDEIASVLLSMSKMNMVQEPGLSRAIYVAGVAKVERIDAQTCANLMVASGALSVSDKESSLVLLNRVLELGNSINSADVVQVLLGL